MFKFTNEVKILHSEEPVCVRVRKLAMNIVFILCIIQIGASELSLDTLIRVTVGVLDRYHSTCVYLLHTTHQQGECHGKCYNCELLI
jgi:hypothetical protein